MAKFHINAKGEAGPCSAQSGNCPFGGDEVHYPSAENARKAFELSSAAAAMPPAAKKRLSLKSGRVEYGESGLRPLPSVEAEVNSYPSCYTEKANDALRHATATMYEYAAAEPRTVPEFDAEVERVFDELEAKYMDDGVSDSEPRWYWKDHMDRIRKDHGWAVQDY